MDRRCKHTFRPGCDHLEGRQLLSLSGVVATVPSSPTLLLPSPGVAATVQPSPPTSPPSSPTLLLPSPGVAATVQPSPPTSPPSSPTSPESPSLTPLVSQATVRPSLQTSQRHSDQFYTKWTPYPGTPGCWYSYYQYYSPTYQSWRWNYCIWYSKNPNCCYVYSPYSKEYWGYWDYPTQQFCRAINPYQGATPQAQHYSDPGDPPKTPDGGQDPMDPPSTLPPVM